MKYQILLVDDDEVVAETLKLILSDRIESNEITMTWLQSGEEALHEIICNPNKYAVVLLDNDLKSQRDDLTELEKESVFNGIETAEAILSRVPETQIVMQSADDTRDLLKQLMKLNIPNFIDKPIDKKKLTEVLNSYLAKYDRHLRKYEIEKQVKDQMQEAISEICPDLIGRSKSLYKVCERIKSLKDIDSRVLIFGENGTGKELVARAIHQNSQRSNKDFVAVNVGAINENLMESEMFGHEKGAFTGATSRKEGKFQLADGGTLFLDEIGELPMSLQAKLLRVLQENEVEPVGSGKPIKVDVRIIAATNVDLDKAVSEGRFREDLFHRLSVVPIKLDPLRKRTDDIRPLVDFAINKYWDKDRKLKHSVYKSILTYSWPGNVRELLNLFERWASLPSKTISEEHLDPKMLDEDNQSRVASKAHKDVIDIAEIKNCDELNAIKSQIERKFYKKVIIKNGSALKAADVLGVNKTTLYARVKKLGIMLSKSGQIIEGGSYDAS